MDRRKKIFIVSDDKEFIENAINFFHENGFIVLNFKTADQCQIGLARHRTIRAVIIDYQGVHGHNTYYLSDKRTIASVIDGTVIVIAGENFPVNTNYKNVYVTGNGAPRNLFKIINEIK